MISYDDILTRRKIEKEEEWYKYAQEIPYLNFPEAWKVRAVPPFAGAMIRYNVILPCGMHKSIYLDCHDQLGCYGSPYWEVYPYRGDTGRCGIQDTENLMLMIANTEKGDEE